jgi:hypothetical protein
MGLSINTPIGAAISLIKDGLDRWGPADKTKVAELKSTLDELKENDDAKELDDQFQVQLAGLGVVKAEAQGESFLQRNWRPITALTLVWLLVSYFYGWTAPNLTPQIIDWLFRIIETCLGGYTIGRSGEKIARTVAPALKAAFSK